MPRVSSKNQVTIPVACLRAAGLGPGDEVEIEADGSERIVLRRAHPPEEAFGVFDGLYERDYLERLRDGERA